MSREEILILLSGIREDIVAQCETYSPPERKRPSEKEKRMIPMKKAIVVALAACLLLGMVLTAYATGAFESLISKWENGFILPNPSEEILESDPEYADYLDQRWQMRDEINAIGEKANKETQIAEMEGLPGASLTLLESYYDGQWIVAALRLNCPAMETQVILDADSFEQHTWQESYYSIGSRFWESMISDEDQRSQILERVENNEPVGFYGQQIFIGDGTWINNERCFLPSSEPDGEGVFIISPYQDVPNEIGLPENAIDQESVDMMLKVKHSYGYFWIEDGKVYERQRMTDIYPVHFTLKNINN